MEQTYIRRLEESILERRLKSTGCVLVAGPKACGKTTLSKRFGKSSVSLKTNKMVELALSDPHLMLKGEIPHLIDEWQKAPEIWNLIKDDLDQDYVFGKYILTGSTTPVDASKILHSGAGRISTLTLRPFTLFESGESNGSVSLSELFNNPQMNIPTMFENQTSLMDIAYYMCRGGWPISLMAGKEYAIDSTIAYFDALFTVDNENDDFYLLLKDKDISLLKLILKEYARNISTQAKKSSMIAAIIQSGERSKLDEDTFSKYVDVLKKLFIVYDLPAWNLNLRTTVAVRTAPTHHFFDPSIALCSLGILEGDLLNDLKSFGLFFEDFVLRDLSVYAESIRGTLKHYRDSSGQEVDCIIELPNTEYAAIEVKLHSEKNLEEGIKSLNSFEQKMKSNDLKSPRFKMIVTSHGPCYQNKDGIYIVPITCLKN